MFAKILIALKFSPTGLYALKKGTALARIHGANLHIFHALDYHFKDVAPTDSRLKSALDAVNQRFEKEIKPTIGDLTHVSFEYFPADPALEACRTAKTIGADLIVLGCHQSRHNIYMARIDYVGMTILENSPCPVLLVPLAE
jgi:nucleotide-binding universal stress UspA family protein